MAGSKIVGSPGLAGIANYFRPNSAKLSSRWGSSIIAYFGGVGIGRMSHVADHGNHRAPWEAAYRLALMEMAFYGVELRTERQIS
jgi:hypothetical protein